jgi:hypothetical protein
METHLIFYFLIATLTSVIFALLEIQIEGEHGWASKLPTWKFQHPWFRYIPGGNKPLTGYHLYLWWLLITIPHFSFLFTEWTLGKEFFTLSFVIFILRLEDFLWFVLNPSYGIRKFQAQFIPWHTNWWIGLPAPYWFSLMLWSVTFFEGVKSLG